MSAGLTLAPLWTAAILILSIGLGSIRLWLRRRSAPADMRAPAWRFALLATLQIAAGALLFLTLHPPSGGPRGGTLTVATRGATPDAVRTSEEIVVALPEAGAIPGAERTPDLATALRRHPDVTRLKIIGEGLPPRDRIPFAIPIEMDPTPDLPGFADIALPHAVAPGARFSIGGQVVNLSSGAVELVDPAGAVVARASITTGQRFILTGTARTAGLALFDLRLRDTTGRLIDRLDVPLETRADPRPRVIVLAGAPGPEINVLRRWARAADINLAASFVLGGGVEVGDVGAPPTREALSKADLLIVDDRRWETLSPDTRKTIVQAVDGGLGLLLRPTGPLSGATRREWSILGAPLSGDGDARPLPLGDDGELPGLTRRNFTDEGDRAVSVLRGPDGTPFASWRARGRGRIAVWTVMDSYALSFSGRPDVHADLWGPVFSALARPIDTVRPHAIGPALVGERLTLCGIDPGARASVNGRSDVVLLIDPFAGPEGCAAFWPTRSGWSVIRTSAGGEAPFYVHSRLPASLTASAAERLAVSGPPSSRAPARAATAPGASWPWFLACLASLAALWWLERRRLATRQPAE